METPGPKWALGPEGDQPSNRTGAKKLEAKPKYVLVLDDAPRLPR